MVRKVTFAAFAGVFLTLLCGAANAGCQLGKIAELPVTMRDFQPLVPAAINGHDVLFLADSGAFYSMITPSTAAELKLPLDPAPWNLTVNGVGGAAARLNVTKVKTLTLTGVPLSGIQFLVLSGVGGDLAGVFGQNFLGLADVEYDLSGGAIRLIKPKGCGGASFAYWAGAKPYSVIDIDLPTTVSEVAKGTAYVNGVRIHVLFDTGASSSVLSLSAARRAGVTPTTSGTVPVGDSHGIGSHMVQTWSAPFSSFKLGDEEIKNTRLRIGDISLQDVDMLLGADFFLSHRVYVANSQHKLYFTYNGGPVFNLTAAANPTFAPPNSVDAGASGDAAKDALSATAQPAKSSTAVDLALDAEGFSRRGAALAARRDYDAAISDFTKAIALAPANAAYFYQRAMARLAVKQLFLAMGDLDQTLKLSPGNVQALAARARLRLAGQDKAGSAADVDEASRVAPKEADARLQLAVLYGHLDKLDQALAEDDLWIASHSGDGQMGEALNNRCWIRALEGRDLDKALADCNRAARLTSDNAVVLDSRGLVYLRRGEFDRAIGDYNTALSERPKSPWSLFGRGLARLAKGQIVDGRADIDAAKALAPHLADEAKLHGIGPADANDPK